MKLKSLNPTNSTLHLSLIHISMWYRLSRREDDYCIECSEDGIRFKQMRICHMWAGAGTVSYTHLKAV